VVEERVCCPQRRANAGQHQPNAAADQANEVDGQLEVGSGELAIRPCIPGRHAPPVAVRNKHMWHALMGEQRRSVASGGGPTIAAFLAGLDAYAATDHLHLYQEHIKSFIGGGEPDRHEVEASAVGAGRVPVPGRHGH
jgi:hypothetical protein